VLSQRVLDYWGKKSRFKGNSVKDLDWKVFGAAMKSVPADMQRWISKTTSGFCATGVMMHRRKERSTHDVLDVGCGKTLNTFGVVCTIRWTYGRNL
jgi:hypothetical protein